MRSHYSTHYAATCPTCREELTATLTSERRFVTPPVLPCACTCRIPVTPVDLIWQIEEEEEDVTPGDHA